MCRQANEQSFIIIRCYNTKTGSRYTQTFENLWRRHVSHGLRQSDEWKHKFVGNECCAKRETAKAENGNSLGAFWIL